MNRGKKIIFVSHCLLNVNVKVPGLATHQSAVKNLIHFLLDHDTAMIQLPCPETEILGLCRWGHVKDQLAYPFFEDHCRSLLAPFIRQIRMYRKNRYHLKGIIGIDGSPSCGVHKTCRSVLWSGDFLDKEDTWKKIQDLKWCAEPGIFMEIFQTMLMENNLSLDFFAVDETDIKTSLVSVLSIAELTRVGSQIYARTLSPFEIYITIGAVYFVMTYSVALLSRWVEKKGIKWTP